MTEDRLIELETRLAFQDALIQTLSSLLAAQQDRLQAVERQVGEVRRQLRLMSSQDVGSASEEPAPPHY